MFFQAGMVIGALVGGYVVHKTHQTINKKPLNKLKNKIVETRDAAATKLSETKKATSEKLSSFAERYGFVDPPKEK